VLNLPLSPLISLLAFYIRVGGRKLLGGCCFYNLFCSRYLDTAAPQVDGFGETKLSASGSDELAAW